MEFVAKILSTPAARAVIVGILSLPPVKEFLHDLVCRIVAEIFHRRTTDPEYLAKSNAAFELLGAASSEEEQKNALKAIRGLVSGDSL